MMTQEEYMNVTALRAAGWTITQIAEHVGYHPATVSGWLRDGGPPAKRETPVERARGRRGVADPHRRAVGAERAAAGELDHAGDRRGGLQRFVSERHPPPARGAGPDERPAATRKLTMPIVTGPGEEFQFDWSDCNALGPAVGLGP